MASRAGWAKVDSKIGESYFILMLVQSAPSELCAAVDCNDDDTDRAGGSLAVWKWHFEDCCD